MTPIILGICGGSGCGKTTLAKLLADSVAEDGKVCHFTQDCFYKGKRSDQTVEEYLLTVDDPESSDIEELRNVLTKIKTREPAFSLPIYSFEHHSRIGSRNVDATRLKIVIVEGIFLFHDQILRQLFDVKIFMLSSVKDCIIRYAKRDVSERCTPPGSVLAMLPSKFEGYKKFIAPFKREADFVIPTENIRNPAEHSSVTVLKEWIEFKLLLSKMSGL